MRPVPAWLIAQPIAHRGLHNRALGIAENTLPAFDAAARARYAIELDVQLTRNGKAVVFHDDDLRRLTGKHGRVADMTPRRMRELRVLGTDAYPPSLAETLALIDGRVPVFVELKSEGDAGALEAEVAKALEAYDGPAAIMSFSPQSVGWFRANAPSISRGQLAGSYKGEAVAAIDAYRSKMLRLLDIGAPDFVAHEVTCLSLPVAQEWRRLGKPLLTWTARGRRAYEAARTMADAVIFEACRPDA